MDKQWYKSKTVWFNVLSVVVLIVKAIWPDFADFELDPALGAGVLAIVNLVLRFATKVPLSLGD